MDLNAKAVLSEQSLIDYCGSSALWPNFSQPQEWPNGGNLALFPACLWHLVLGLLPLGWLLLSITFLICDLVNKRRDKLQVSALYVIKILFGLIFMIAPAAAIGLHMTDDSYVDVKSMPPAVLVTNGALLLSGLLYLILLEFTRQYGSITSGTLTVFWIINVSSFWFYWTTVYQQSCWGNDNPDVPCGDDLSLAEFDFILFTTQAVASFINLIASGFSERLPDKYNDGSYESNISWLSASFYSFLTPLINLGYKKAKTGAKTGLEEEDVQNIKYRDRTDFRFDDFQKNWDAECERVNAWNEKHPPKPKVTNKVDPEEKDSDKKDAKKEDDGRKKPSLYRALWKTFRHEILVTAGWKLMNDILVFVNPQLLKALLAFLGSDESSCDPVSDPTCPPNPDPDTPPVPLPNWAGYLYAVGILVTALLTTFVLQRYWYHCTRVGVHVRCALTAMIYRKSLKVNFANEGTTVGEVVNYMSVDAQRFQDTATFMNFLWSAPLQIALSLYFLYNELDWAAFTILGVFIVLAPLSGVITGKLRNKIGVMMKKKDKRIKVMNEILNGVKVLKLYAWETPFMKKVSDIRDEELSVMYDYGILQGLVILIWEFTPYLVQLVAFAVYASAIGDLNPENVYTSLSIFNIIRFPINMLPMVAIMVTMTNVASDRIGGYLATTELDRSAIEHRKDTKDKDNKLEITGGNFSYKKDGENVLTDCDVTVNRGEIVAVVGPVGCGKSSMVSAFLGELQTQTAKVKISGNLAYVPQQAWIQNMTLKDNIVFGYEYDEKKYNEVIDACCLISDLEILESGDGTEIGERGINLSGGQKQRVSIARAVYSNADLYIFDDPLSAVDAHVGRRIFTKVFGPAGLLKDKTRLLVTHSTQYLPDVDNIIVMETGGKILAQGDLNTLKGLKDARVEEIISVKAREEEEEEEGGEKKDLKTQKSQKVEPGAKEGAGKDGALIAKEKAEEGAVSSKVFTEYFKNFGYGWMLFYVFVSLVYMVADLLYSIWLTAWVDAIMFMTDENAEEAGKNEACGMGAPWTSPSFLQTDKCYGNNFYLGIYGLIGVSIALISFSKSMVQLQGIIKSGRSFHKNILTGIMRSPMEFFDTTPTGRIVNRFGKDIDAVDMTIPGSVRSWISCLLRIFSTMVILGRTNIWFLLILPPLFILFFLIERYYIAANRQLKRMESTTRSPIYSNFNETISGTSVIRAYNEEKRFIAENVQKIDHNLKFQYANLMCNRWLGIRLEAFANLIVFSVAIYAVISRGAEDGPSSAEMGLALTYSISITQVLNFLIRTTAELEVNLVAIERISEYSELEPEADWRREGKKGWMAKGHVEFNKYALRYREGLPLVLRQLDCQISGGEKIGVVGRTGAGKSSLTVGMFRLVEAAEGEINIDKTKSAQLGLHDLRENLTIIPQEPVLFSGTLRENLDPFEEAADDRIWKALELAHLKKTVSGFDKKLEHDINENGSNLSVGERQLVCLARALLRDSKLLILDEATSAVDNNTDGLIQQTIREEFKDMTILTIAHRLNTIIDYDRVMVLDEGSIVEFDSPKNLFEKKEGIFRSMCIEANVSVEDIENSSFGNTKSAPPTQTKEKNPELDFNAAEPTKKTKYEATDF